MFLSSQISLCSEESKRDEKLFNRKSNKKKMHIKMWTMAECQNLSMIGKAHEMSVLKWVQIQKKSPYNFPLHFCCIPN